MTSVPNPPADLAGLRAEVRAYLDDAVSATDPTRPGPLADCWQIGWDQEFSQRLADRGWIGMTLPTELGGRGRSFLERWVITDELLMAGAPVAAHWIADRQSAPTLINFGNEHLQQRYVPGIATGRITFAIGMSEPDSGSDLASVHTRGTRVTGGWRINGTKVWTTGAHHADAFIALVRTSPLDTTRRHDGLSQFVIPLDTEGVEISPIYSGNGMHHFNQVLLDDVFVPEENLVGAEGNGWAQVNSELSYERSGPERILSTFAPFWSALLDHLRDPQHGGDAQGRGGNAAGITGTDGRHALVPGTGRFIARMTALHSMSFGVARKLAAGQSVAVEAAVVKRLGTTFEGDLAEFLDTEFSGTVGAQTQDQIILAIQERPNFTIRGGSNEILSSVITKPLVSGRPAVAERPLTVAGVSADITTMFHEALPQTDYSATVRETAQAASARLRAAWEALREQGLVRLSRPESAGGGSGTLADAAALAGTLAAKGLDVASADDDIVVGWLAERTGRDLPAGAHTFGLARRGQRSVTFPHAAAADGALALVQDEAGWTAHRLDRSTLADEGTERYGRDRHVTLPLERVRADAAASMPLDADTAAEAVARHEATLLFATLGAADRAVSMTLAHITQREQFGRPLSKFQAVQNLLADVVSNVELIRATTESLIEAADANGFLGAGYELAVARAAAGRAIEPVVRASHQAHGAIGTTREYPLHALTGTLLDARATGIRTREWEELLAGAATRLDLRELLAPTDSTRAVVREEFLELLR